jgi:hypothetical protein
MATGTTILSDERARAVADALTRILRADYDEPRDLLGRGATPALVQRAVADWHATAVALGEDTATYGPRDTWDDERLALEVLSWWHQTRDERGVHPDRRLLDA